MSAVEEARQTLERGGSVKLVRNAKGDMQWEIKSYVEDEPGAIDQAATEALRIHAQLIERFGGATDSEFIELGTYAECPRQCIDMGYRPGASLIRKGWLREVVSGCWQITDRGQRAFEKVVDGASEVRPDRDEVA